MNVDDTNRRGSTRSLLAVVVVLILVAAGVGVYFMYTTTSPSSARSLTPTSSTTSVSSTTASVTSAAVQNLTTTLKGLTLAVFYPPGKDLPLVVFSMGYCLGCPGYYQFYLGFVEDVAASGFAAAYLNQSAAAGVPTLDKLDQFIHEEVANITAVINYMNSTYPVGNVDLSHIALVGHSAGGAATLNYLSIYPSKIRCAVGLAPWSDGNVTRPTTTPPFMVIAGRFDTSVLPWIAHDWITNLTAPSKEYVVVSAYHWLNLNETGTPTYDSVLNHTVSFLKAHMNYAWPTATTSTVGDAAILLPAYGGTPSVATALGATVLITKVSHFVPKSRR